MKLVDYSEAKKFLDSYKIKSIDSKYVNNFKEAISFAKEEPIVLKAISNKALHKSKEGLVMLGLNDEKEITRAFMALEKRAARFSPYKIQAQKMAKGGVEIIIGGRSDPQFGKLILIGLGGIYVEAFRDFALRICPITRYDAMEMLNQLRSKEVVTFKGEHTEMLADLLMKVSKMLIEHKDIEELDLNPVIISEKGYEVVDIRILE